MNEVRLVADHVGVSERTLRRAINEGALRATRPTPRTLEMSFAERDYVRRKWPLLSALRAALRTEPNVRFALLFGSVARDRDTPNSDIDLLVELRDTDFERLVDLGVKLQDVVGCHVDVVELHEAQRDPALLAGIVAEGRVLVDREQRWTRLNREEGRLRKRGERRQSDRLSAALAGIDNLLASA